MSRTFLEVIEGDPPAVVDCGTCPVNVACAINAGGLGLVFRCCGATAVRLIDAETEPGTVYVLDCQRHNYPSSSISDECDACPLCTGDVVYGSLAGVLDANVYVPTIYARVPLRERLRLWRNKLPEAKKVIAEEAAAAKEET